MEVKVIVIGNVQELHVFYSVLVHLRRSGGIMTIRVSIFLNLLLFVLWCWCSHVLALMFLRAMVKLKCLTDCQVTNSNPTKCLQY